MKFKDFKYERPDIELFKKKFEEQLLLIGKSDDAKAEIKAIYAYYDILDEFDTLSQLAYIRSSIDTKDAFYDAEKEFLDEKGPELSVYSNAFNHQILSSKNRLALEKEFGKLLFERAEVAKRTFHESIIPLLQQENKLSSQYSKLVASAQISFEGGTYNLSQMAPFTQSIDRETRHQAQLAVSNFFESNQQSFDKIYDDLVKVRDEIAKKLGYKNFIQLGYDRFGRTDYNSSDVKKYRDQIYADVVPVVNALTQRKAKRLGIEKPKSYDLALSFLTGNPTPKGDVAWQVDKARTMYKEMSPETHEFFEFMLKSDLLDLESKPGKEGGGYCTFIPGYQAPFIFANFNGTSHDVDVLTHEAGHAFQVYSSRKLLPEYRWPTMEAAEIHSMSMEFLAWPWMDTFFIEDTDKYKFNHMASAISFLPYGVLVDEFQHEVYEKPNLTPKERKTLWSNLEKKYLPFKDYDDDKFLEAGGFWFRQGHIFAAPFYYIDYTLAEVVAFQYWIAAQENFKEAWDSYLSLCKLGGSKSFVNLLETAGLKNPFKPGTVKKIMKSLSEYLDSVDDLKL